MSPGFLIYREILPLLPESTWHTSKELYAILLRHKPELKLSGLRVSLRAWEKKGYLLTRQVNDVANYGRKTRKLYLRLDPDKKFEVKILNDQRVCLRCRIYFWPLHRFNFMCPPCGKID